jgi:hypothetical protein
LARRARADGVKQARLQRDSAIRPLELAYWHQIGRDEPH